MLAEDAGGGCRDIFSLLYNSSFCLSGIDRNTVGPRSAIGRAPDS